MKNVPLSIAVAFLVLSCLIASKLQLKAATAAKNAPLITQALIPKGKHGRHRMTKMKPTHITIHSTQNFDTGADAAGHAKALATGSLKSKHNSLGYLTWHYTVDQNSIYQSIPDKEQGQHADYDGPGNRSSIGIEMCENKGNSRERTLNQTAKLTAWLMRKHNIPLSNVVPHYHWKRIRSSDSKNMGHKACPHFLMDKGKPGKKWQAFINQVKQIKNQ